MFVDRHQDRHGHRLHHVDWVVQDRPVELLPLGEQAAALGMLLLGDAQQNELAFLDPLLCLLVPNWHVSATAGSPGGELDEQHLLASKLSERDALAI